MKILFQFCMLIFLLFIAFGCEQKREKTIRPFVYSDGISPVADTIIYDVIIKNNNPLDHWAEECLKDLNHNNLVTFIFESAYSGKYQLFDYFSGKELSPRDIKKMEKEDNDLRLTIGKVQFTERWYTNDSTQQLNKDIISIVPGMEIIGLDGEVRGYKPAFKIKFE